MSRFDGKVAIVSGGARGMGASHATGLVAEGAKVVIGDLLTEEGNTLAADLGDAARFVDLNVTQQSNWTNAVEIAEGEFGPVDILVNNAGIFYPTPIVETSEAEFRRIIDVNLVGTFLGMHTVVPSMRKAGEARSSTSRRPPESWGTRASAPTWPASGV